MQQSAQRTKAKLRLISQYIKKGRYNPIFKLLTQLEKVEKTPLQTIEYYNFKGYVFLKKGFGTVAETNFQKAAELAQKLPRQASIQNNEFFAEYFQVIGNYQQTEILLKENITFYTEQEDVPGKNRNTLSLAHLKILQEHYQKASDLLEAVQSEIVQGANKFEMVRYYQYFAKLLINWQRGDPEDFADLALVLARERGFRENMAHLFLLKGQAGVQKRGNNYESMGYLEGSLFYIQELELNELYPEVYREIALLYETLEEFSSMETYLNKASQHLAKSIKNYPVKARKSYQSLPIQQHLAEEMRRCQNMLSLEQKTNKEVARSLGEDSIDDFFLIDVRLFEEKPSLDQDLDGSQVFLSKINVEVSKHQEEQNYNDLLKILYINQKLNQEYNQKKLMEFILDMIIDVAKAERGFLVLSAKGKHMIRVARNIDREELKKPDMKVSHTILQKMFQTGQEVVLDNAMEEEGFKGNKSIFNQKLRSVLCVPLAIKNRVVGGVYLDNRFVPGAFNKQTLFHVKLLATQAAIALENTKLNRELQARQIKLEGYTKEIKKLNRQLKGQIQTQQDELIEVKQQLSLHQAALETKYNYQDIIAQSTKMQQLLKSLDKVIDSRLPVLIQGESGTGKELIAKAIHYNGPRKKSNFVSINCAALPEPLLESELFGHKKGAFTGATEEKKGLFEIAGDGTIFLDEVGDMPLTMQTKILRVLQEEEVRPLGGKEIVAIKARIVAATNHNLQERIKAGKFREDLYYRLCVIELKLPPLRERLEDIPMLIEYFLEQEANEAEQTKKEIDTSILSYVMEYSWPGNIRELKNEVQRWHAMAENTINPTQLSDRIRQNFTKSRIIPQKRSFKELIEEYERELISQKLSETKNNKTKAAKELGLSRDGLRKILIRLGLEDLKKQQFS